jgi:hypothetical protein
MRAAYHRATKGKAAMRLRRFRTGLGAGLIGAAIAAAPADADGWSCGASALRAGVAGQTAEPAAVAESTPCRAATTELAAPPLPPGLSAGALSARTATPSESSAVVHDVAVGLPVGLLPIPGAGLVDAVPPVNVPAPPPLGTVSVDLRPALLELLRPVPTVELLRVGSATASATGRCVGGDPVISGSSATAGAVLAGQPIDPAGPHTQAVELLGGYAIDPSNIDVADVVQSGGSLTPAVLRPLLQPILDAMPPIPVPATLADVSLVPDEQIADGGRRVYRALHVRAAVAGTELVDAVLAEASAGGDDCRLGSGSRGSASVADLALQCASQQVVLIDVLNTGRRVKLFGAAAGRYVGRTVAIRLASTGRVVARPVVGEDGTFRATAPLPARKIRGTNAARYRASIDGERSLPLKLSRRMIVTRTSSTARGTTIRGRVTGPLARGASVTVKRRLSCTRWKVVKRFKPRGRRFRVTVPNAGGASVFRLQTTVAALDRTGRRKPTFTLPRYVTFR